MASERAALNGTQRQAMRGFHALGLHAPGHFFCCLIVEMQWILSCLEGVKSSQVLRVWYLAPISAKN